MAVLKNAKHERFAQARFGGQTADEAYVSAGYSENRGNAGRMNANEAILARVAELQAEVAQDTKVTVAGITARLLAIAAKGELKDDAPMLSVARASLMDAAKLNGLVTDKTQFAGVVGTADAANQAGMAELSRWAGEALSGVRQAPDAGVSALRED